MLTTDKYSCRCLARALSHYGVRQVVVSPGSRNAPLAVALARTPGLECRVVIDERSAAFIALGMAIESGEPVAMVCTSGSAALNYAPALAEAFYRRIPLIAVTADRPEEWIDQDDSQTIRQPGALSAVVKATFDIPVDRGDAGLQRLCRRRIADALMLATAGISGPVHINVQIDEPINAMCDDDADRFDFPNRDAAACKLTSDTVLRLTQKLKKAHKVLVVAGFMPPCSRLSELLAALPGNFAVLCEVQSNLRGPFAANIDACLSVMSDAEKDRMLNPDIVVTIGGSLLSRMIKVEFRKRDVEHWSIGLTDHCIDPLLNLSERVECTPLEFFEAVVPALAHAPSDYRERWLEISSRASARTLTYLHTAPWSDFKAMGILLQGMPAGLNLHLSNGTVVRYAQLFGTPDAARVECNRGVSGIDGCTSTAIGAAMASEHPTLLVTGDMCAQYDMGALATCGIPGSFRMAVLNNGGGGIFRFIAATRDLPEMERFLAADVRLPLRQLAEGFGFDYLEADSAEGLQRAIPYFFADNGRPAILNIITPADVSAQTIRNYFSKS